MQKHNTSQKIRQMRIRMEAQADELMHLEQMDMQVAGQSDYIDEIATLYCDAMTIDGRDERRTARALSYAGLRTSWH
jgi:ketosteroid isomerase-like protein